MSAPSPHRVFLDSAHSLRADICIATPQKSPTGVTMMRLSAFAIFTLMWVTYFDVEAQVDTGAGYIYKLPVTQVLHYFF